MTGASTSPQPLKAKWAGLGAAGAGVVGGIIGLVVGLDAHPPTAWFAVFELGIPSAILGALLGLLAGALADAVHARRVRQHD